MTSFRAVLELTSKDDRTIYMNVPHIRAVYANATGIHRVRGKALP